MFLLDISWRIFFVSSRWQQVRPSGSWSAKLFKAQMNQSLEKNGVWVVPNVSVFRVSPSDFVSVLELLPALHIIFMMSISTGFPSYVVLSIPSVEALQSNNVFQRTCYCLRRVQRAGYGATFLEVTSHSLRMRCHFESCPVPDSCVISNENKGTSKWGELSSWWNLSMRWRNPLYDDTVPSTGC
jgi:hypothetical protein